MSEKTQLTSLKNSPEFNLIFNKLLVEDIELSKKEQEYILLCALLFFKVYNNDNRFRSYFKLGYHIVLKYSLILKDFKPLYDISMQIGFYPIAKIIVELNQIAIESIPELISYKIVNDKFKNKRENYVETLEQFNAGQKLLSNERSHLVYTAPTSFGKSSMIKDFILKGTYDKICVVVPTKSLLVQTYNDLKELGLGYKLITHDEMFDNEKRFIGILTQERATRLLGKGTSFDLMFIDEAHNIFRYNSKNQRGILLARLIELNKSLNNHKVIYLSPLIDNPENIKLSSKNEVSFASVKHNVKSEDVFLLEDNNVSLYNRFTNEYLDILSNVDIFNYIRTNAKNKNFIYNYRPVKIEQLSKELFENIVDELDNQELRTISSTLTNEVHESFYINKYIKKGIVYIHGKIPNHIKEYLEHKFKTVSCLKYIVANKVILEGVNLPIDTIFITSTTYLDGKELVNLIGRVNRLNYLFKEKNLAGLNPKIHFVNTLEYQGANSMRNKIELLRNHSFEDRIENPLLASYSIDKLDFSKTELLTKHEVKERRRQLDKLIVDNTNFLINNKEDNSILIRIKRYFIENSFEEFYKDIDSVVKKISDKFQIIPKSWGEYTLVQKVFHILINELSDEIKDYEIERLKNSAARNYYNFFLTTTQKQSLKQNILATFNYLKSKSISQDPFLFIGQSYGDSRRSSDIYHNQVYRDTVYVNLFGKSDEILINLSIVKLKIEEDFVGYKLNKMIVFLFDFNLIGEEEYLMHIYGTLDSEIIKLTRLGLIPSAVHKIVDDGQAKNLKLDDSGNLIANDSFYGYLAQQNDLFNFEVRKYL